MRMLQGGAMATPGSREVIVRSATAGLSAHFSVGEEPGGGLAARNARGPTGCRSPANPFGRWSSGGARDAAAPPAVELGEGRSERPAAQHGGLAERLAEGGKRRL